MKIDYEVFCPEKNRIYNFLSRQLFKKKFMNEGKNVKHDHQVH